MKHLEWDRLGFSTRNWIGAFCRSGLAAGVLAPLLLAAPGLAQEPNSPEVQEAGEVASDEAYGQVEIEAGSLLEEILVTAQRRETLLQETPVAVTTFSEDAVEEIGIFDITDISAMAPNTVFNKQPSSNSNTSIAIRGVGSGETSLMVDPKVGVYIDGMYMSKTVGGVFDIIDIESIEVLRGPQGTLFGRNSSGGALNITTAKPSGEFNLKAQASMGNDGYRRYSATLDLPKVGDMLSAKFSGMLMDYDGWANNDYPGQESDLGSEDNGTYRIAVRFQPVDGLTVDYTYDRTDNEGVPTPFQIVEVKSSLYNGFTTTPFPFTVLGGQLFQEMAATIGDPNDRREDYNLDFVSKEELDVKGHGLTVAWDAENFTLKYIFADRRTDSTYARTDLDGGAHRHPDLFYGGGMPVPTPGFHAAITDGYVKMTTHEVQLFGDLAEARLHYTLGYYNYEEEVYQDNPQTFGLPAIFLAPRNPLLGALYRGAGICNDVPGQGLVCIGSQRMPLPFPFPGADPNSNGFVDFVYGQNADSWAVYGQFTFTASERLDLTGGLRYTKDKKSGFLFNENLFHVSLDDQLTNAEKWDNLSYLLTLNYRVHDDMNVYFTHSTGYNAGGFNARAGSVSGFALPVAEEEISSLELGLKTEWWNNRLRTNVAAYRAKFKDIQIAQFEAGSGGASSRLVNAGDTTNWGVELDAVAVLAEGLIADLSYGYLNTKFNTYLARNPATDQEVDIADVTTVGGVPKHTANVGLSYEFKPFAVGTLSARLGATYRGDVVFHPFLNQHDKSDGYWLLNARVSLKDIAMGESSALRISAWVRNLTDNEYREFGIDFSSLGFAGVTFGRPRTFGIDFVYEMGN